MEATFTAGPWKTMTTDWGHYRWLKWWAATSTDRYKRTTWHSGTSHESSIHWTEDEDRVPSEEMLIEVNGTLLNIPITKRACIHHCNLGHTWVQDQDHRYRVPPPPGEERNQDQGNLEGHQPAQRSVEGSCERQVAGEEVVQQDVHKWNSGYCKTKAYSSGDKTE